MYISCFVIKNWKFLQTGILLVSLNLQLGLHYSSYCLQSECKLSYPTDFNNNVLRFKHICLYDLKQWHSVHNISHSPMTPAHTLPVSHKTGCSTYHLTPELVISILFVCWMSWPNLKVHVYVYSFSRSKPFSWKKSSMFLYSLSSLVENVSIYTLVSTTVFLLILTKPLNILGLVCFQAEHVPKYTVLLLNKSMTLNKK